MRTGRKKILFITRWYPDRNDPMPGLFVRRHAEAVSLNSDVDVLYVTADKSLKAGHHYTEQFSEGPIREFKIYFGKHRWGLLNGIAYIRWYFKGLKLTGKPDITHIHVLTRTVFPALWLKYTSGIPYVITEHWSRYLPTNVAAGSYRGWLRRFFTALAVRKASAVTTVTENLAKAMQQLKLNNQYFITPNVADTERFSPVKIHTISNKKSFIHVSCFDEPAKNIKGIINVFAKISKYRSDFELTIIGTGPDEIEILEFADNTGLKGKFIHFTGLLEGVELQNRMKSADAMVMFSNYENLPCTIVESICCGVPVISTDVGGIKEHLNTTNGILIAAGDEAGLEQAVLKLLDGQFKTDKNAIRRYGLEHFSMTSVSEIFESVYNRIKSL